jgi:hypothetical protein
VLITHDPEIAAVAPRVVRISDGVLTEEAVATTAAELTGRRAPAARARPRGPRRRAASIPDGAEEAASPPERRRRPA